MVTFVPGQRAAWRYHSVRISLHFFIKNNHRVTLECMNSFLEVEILTSIDIEVHNVVTLVIKSNNVNDKMTEF